MASTRLKPPGVPVFPFHADPSSDCVLARLLIDEPERAGAEWPEGFAGGIAHRLDVATSGAILVADDPDELMAIRAAFKEGRFTKVYRFESARAVSWPDNTCDRAIAHDRKKRRRMIVQRGPNTPHRGRWYPARTDFRRLDNHLVEATMHTGVMHQIRAHAAFLGIPLAGDRLYGGGGDGQFRLHHMGLRGAGLATDPVPTPAWASPGPR